MTYPPTTDYAAVKLFWRDLQPGRHAGGGDGHRARAAGRRWTSWCACGGKARETRSQVILLLTDGEDTESEPLEVAEEAAQLGVKIFAVGIGSRSGELIPEVRRGRAGDRLPQGRRRQVRHLAPGRGHAGQAGAETGGEYLRADVKRFGVEAVEQALAGLKRTENEARLVKQYDDIYEILMLPAFLLLVGEACMSERRRKAVAPVMRRA